MKKPEEDVSKNDLMAFLADCDRATSYGLMRAGDNPVKRAQVGRSMNCLAKLRDLVEDAEWP